MHEHVRNEVEYRREVSKVTFRDLKRGQMFSWPTNPDRSVIMKVAEESFVNLRNGFLDRVPPDSEVIPFQPGEKVTLIVGEKVYS